MVNLIDELIGREFDWLAMDLDGNIALLSSAGYGTIPEAVQMEYKSYDDLTNNFELNNFGSDKVWEDFAKYGLYVYNWKLHGGPYIKKSAPLNTMTEELKNSILSIKNLTKLNVKFELVNELNILV